MSLFDFDDLFSSPLTRIRDVIVEYIFEPLFEGFEYVLSTRKGKMKFLIFTFIEWLFLLLILVGVLLLLQ